MLAFGLLLTQLLAHFGQLARRQMTSCRGSIEGFRGLWIDLPVGLQGGPQIGTTLLACGLTHLIPGPNALNRLRESPGC